MWVQFLSTDPLVNCINFQLKIIASHKAKEQGLSQHLLHPDQVGPLLRTSTGFGAPLSHPVTSTLLVTLTLHLILFIRCTSLHTVFLGIGFDVIPQATLPSHFQLNWPVRPPERDQPVEGDSSRHFFPSSLFWCQGSGEDCSHMTKVLRRAPTSPWFQLLPPKDLAVEMGSELPQLLAPGCLSIP